MSTMLPEAGALHGCALARETPLTKEGIAHVLEEARSASAILFAAGQDSWLQGLLDTPTQLFEGGTIGEHTEMVLSRLYMYPFLPEEQSSHGGPLSRREFALAYLFHDLGKRLPDTPDLDMLQEAQHERTLTIFHHYRPVLPVSDEQLRILIALIDGDPLGTPFRLCLPQRPTIEEKEHLRNELANHPDLNVYRNCVDTWEERVRSQPIPEEQRNDLLQKAALEICKKAQALGMDPLQFLHFQTIFFQCDASAYTWDARTSKRRGVPSIDFIFQRNELVTNPSDPLFLFDSANGLLRFSLPFEKLYAILKRLLVSGRTNLAGS